MKLTYTKAKVRERFSPAILFLIMRNGMSNIHNALIPTYYTILHIYIIIYAYTSSKKCLIILRNIIRVIDIILFIQRCFIIGTVLKHFVIEIDCSSLCYSISYTVRLPAPALQSYFKPSIVKILSI